MGIGQHNFSHLSNVRVSGVLTADAQLAPTMGAEPHTLLCIDLQPPVGLAYHARIDLGPDPTERMLAEGHLPYLRRGALVSVAGKALELRIDHGHAVLRVIGACDLFIPHD